MPDAQHASFKNGGLFTLSTQLVKPNQLANCQQGQKKPEGETGVLTQFVEKCILCLS